MTTTEVSTDLVLTERHDGVLTITINRPAQKNAVSREVAVHSQPPWMCWTLTRRCRWAC
jgi:1,4-dihydroxy-2-naphthoyl-CoA synthase